MKIELSPSMDHNQMLVVSVFLHLLAITVIMFSPKPVIKQPRVIPTFNFDVVEIPRLGEPSKAPKEAARPKAEPPPSEETAVKETKPVEPPTVKTPQPIKKADIPKPKAPAPKAAEKPAPPKPAEKPAPPKSEEKKAPPKPAVKPAPTTSKIVEELERLEEKPKGPALVNELDQLAKLEPPVPTTPKRPAPGKISKPEQQKSAEDVEPKKEMRKKEEPIEKETEFDVLANKPLNPEKETKEKSAIEELNELKRQTLLDSLKSQKIKPDVAPKQIDLSVVSKPAFNSSLRKLELADSRKAVDGQKATQLPRPKSPSDPLSMYAGAVEEKIYSNWKSPLGAKNNEVYVSFFLFSQGNIGKPFIEKSSGNEQLDSLAIRAILDSEPFPAFPPDLKEPSLHLTIHFKYIPQG